MKNSNQNGALIYGTEYENTGAIDKNHDTDAACAVCMRKGGEVYVQWGRTSCSNSHTRMYWGVIMADYYGHRKSNFECVDWDRAIHARSSNANHNGALLYTTEIEGGSSDESQYPHDRELACAVCQSKNFAVYTRWGHNDCPSTSTKKLWT